MVFKKKKKETKHQDKLYFQSIKVVGKKMRAQDGLE